MTLKVTQTSTGLSHEDNWSVRDFSMLLKRFLNLRVEPVYGGATGRLMVTNVKSSGSLRLVRWTCPLKVVPIFSTVWNFSDWSQGTSFNALLECRPWLKHKQFRESNRRKDSRTDWSYRGLAISLAKTDVPDGLCGSRLIVFLGSELPA